MPGGGAAGTRTDQGSSRSFESVLRQDSGASPKSPAESAGASAPGSGQDVQGVSGARLDRMRTELLPEWLDSNTRIKLLREAMKSVGGSPTGTDLRGRFGQLEKDWYEIEKVMRSSKDLSQGELLGLQARLYQVSQHIEVMSKVVDQMTGGVKTILNTNV